MRVVTQLAVLAVIGGLGAGWHLYGERIGLPKPLALLGLETRQNEVQRPAGPPPNAPLPVAVAPVRIGTVVERAESVGTVRARESVNITAKVAGIITAIHFQEGQMVREGQVLVELDSASVRAEYDQARAAADDARLQLQRARALPAGQAVAQAQIDRLDAALRQAEGRVRQFQARLEELRITAPFSGRVGLRTVSIGALIQPGTLITTLDDTSRVRVEFSVPEIFIARVRPGSQVTATSVAYGARRFEGRVTVADTRIDPATRTLRLVSEFDNPDDALKPGMFLNVQIVLETREQALLVPEEALDPVGDRNFLYVVRQGRAARQEVQVGQRLAGEVEITRGIEPTDQVVVRGLQRLRPNAPVRVTEVLTRPMS
ncbi:MAG: efflux RND transporter periplasmic adaptor subunit [Rhodovarius sp.]|nr:efflux RND transporter periplasmic adaptor subunit [Rhodovarius sp.]MCX7933001.1 efflux RND transporter periplasmic adaptor subunit [Rhodovarius sp.]